MTLVSKYESIALLNCPNNVGLPVANKYEALYVL
jgi:hypothetical protein